MQEIGKAWGKYDTPAGEEVRPRYCLRCQEKLSFFAGGQQQCWKCGQPFDPSDPATYRSSRVIVWWKYWLPAFLLAVVSGVVAYSLLLTAGGDLGWSLFFSVPVSVGAILGYGCRVKVWLILLAAIAAICAIVGILLTLNSMGAQIVGFFCGLTLSLIFIVPTVVGVVLGLVLRGVLQGTKWDQRWFFPVALLVAFPYASYFVEHSFPRRTEVATVRTDLTVDATPEEAWEAIMFYEDVEHAPPWLLYLALPRPERSEGDKSREGEIVTCFYDRGHLSKRISRVEKNRLLAFEVVDQELHFERDVKLKRGSFELVPLADGRTRIILTTEYERKLHPAWLWQPCEETVIHTLHGHVLEGMRRRAEGEAPPPPPPYQPDREAQPKNRETAQKAGRRTPT